MRATLLIVLLLALPVHAQDLTALRLNIRAVKALDRSQWLMRQDLEHTPSISPLIGRYIVTSPFGIRWERLHAGMDMYQRLGSAVRATADGRVVYAGSGHGYDGYGNLVVIEHTPEITTVYAHLLCELVGPGDEVRRGDWIGLVGGSGYCVPAGAVHLHYEIRRDGIPTDPQEWMP